MEATGRARTWKRQSPRTPNRAGKFITSGIGRFGGEPGIRTHLLVERTGAKRTRSRYGTNARFAMAKRGVDRCLYLQRCARRYGGGARLAPPAAIYHSLFRSRDCPARLGRKLF